MYVTIKLELPTRTVLIIVYKTALGSITSRFLKYCSSMYWRLYSNCEAQDAYCQCSPEVEHSTTSPKCNAPSSKKSIVPMTLDEQQQQRVSSAPTYLVHPIT